MSRAVLSMACAGAAAAFLAPQGRSRLVALTPLGGDRSRRPDAPRSERRGWFARRARVAGDAEVPLTLELIAVCLSAGASPADALALVAAAVRGKLATDLAAVARALRLGASAEHAWEPVHAVGPRSVQRAADLFVHAERAGSALAPALTALAAEERRTRQLARASAARRVGVLAAAPLGLCFLPAFVLVGVLPVVAGLLGQLSLS